jgi:hypothetical protein
MSNTGGNAPAIHPGLQQDMPSVFLPSVFDAHNSSMPRLPSADDRAARILVDTEREGSLGFVSCNFEAVCDE